MTLADFENSLNKDTPPGGISDYLLALWYEGKGNWERSHKVIQDINDDTASWIHAYLHRKEGDIGNADYWYARAGKKRPFVSLKEEWDLIVNSLL